MELNNYMYENYIKKFKSYKYLVSDNSAMSFLLFNFLVKMCGPCD